MKKTILVCLIYLIVSVVHGTNECLPDGSLNYNTNENCVFDNTGWEYKCVSQETKSYSIYSYDFLNAMKYIILRPT